MSEDLKTKYRPQVLPDLLGQPELVKSLTELHKKNKLEHAYLFTGNAGTGKTTTARIVANMLGCKSANVIEVDAGMVSGVDDMRQLTGDLKYAAFGESPIKFIIIDEVHGLSKQAFTALLKILEEPPKHIYFALCTTEVGKVPEAIKTRCLCYTLKDVKKSELLDLLDEVCRKEKIDLPDGAETLIASEAQGSPRRALTMLSVARGCQTKEEVARVIETAQDAPDVYQLCKLLASGCTWKEVQVLLKTIKEQQQPESVRIQIVNYFTACALNAKTEGDARRFMAILDTFDTPVYQATGFANIVVGLGRLLLLRS